MEIHVHADGQQLGPFQDDALLEMARLGSIPANALVWHEGVTDWYPLADWRARHEPAGAVASGRTETGAPVRREEGPGATACVIRGVGAGFLVALIGSLLWFGTSLAAGFRIPFVGILIGLGVGYATSKASRGEGTWILPASAVTWTLLAQVPFFSLGIFALGGTAYSLYLAWKFASD